MKDKELRDKFDRLENSYRAECALGADYRKWQRARNREVFETSLAVQTRLRTHDYQIKERAEASLATLELVGVLIQRVNKLQEQVDGMTVRKKSPARAQKEKK